MKTGDSRRYVRVAYQGGPGSHSERAGLTLLKERFTGWPFASFADAAAALANAAASVPVWTASGWSVWRKAHHALFAAAGLFAVYGLWEWRIILAPMTTT